jgi:hypothetical protein
MVKVRPASSVRHTVFGLASRGVTLRFGRVSVEALWQAIVVEMKVANRDPPLGRFHEFGNLQLECARVFLSGQQAVNCGDRWRRQPFVPVYVVRLLAVRDATKASC